MPKHYVTILLLRREISEDQKDALRKLFPEKQINFTVIKPDDFREHDRICTSWGADLVVLPERPIPALAMERGIPHVTISPEGEVLKLLPLKPEFEEFKPKSEST